MLHGAGPWTQNPNDCVDSLHNLPEYRLKAEVRLGVTARAILWHFYAHLALLGMLSDISKQVVRGYLTQPCS